MTQRPTTPVEVRKIQVADHKRVADVLGRAFDDDPVMNFIAKQDARRSQRIRKVMDIALRNMTFPYGETFVAGGYEGAALWNPPNGRPHGLLSDLRMLPGFISVAGLTRLPKLMATLNVMEKKHPKDPHYYLLALGVDPDHQGQGIGTQLMAPILERCDAEGSPAYLESSKERNVPLYERNGFQVTEQLELPNGGPPVWLMWRDPK